ncbi:piggyBac transposable element-derived protein 4-like [Lineus longissimus]|uniref:piggyBac transposable element-derived protein 4-like n=1 Tax=Lineus longissimus TaxID=88925 RepID=UPI00315C9495
MPRDRFKAILRFLHFNDNTHYNQDDPDRDRLYKIRRLIDCLKANCQRAFEPGKNICVDESLLLFKGRLAFKQYIKTKRSRIGVKFYELCTSNGILLDFEIYCGIRLPEIQGLSTTETIVATLIEPHLNAGRCIFLDNYYTSPNLAAWLLARGTYVIGTVKSNRKNFPKALATDRIEKGQSIFYRCNDEHVLAVKFRALKDKSTGKPKIVHLLSTATAADTGPTGKKDRAGNDVIKPTCVLQYNQQMGGVDMMDQQLHGFHTCRKSYKWYKKVAFHMIMQNCLSANKLYNLQQGKKTPFLNYLHDVVAMLLTSSPKLNKLVIREETVHRLTGRHFPVLRGFVPSGKRRKTKNCKVCYARGLRGPSGKPLETVMVCKNCPSHPGLHVDRDCFEAYHTEVDYSGDPLIDNDDY